MEHIEKVGIYYMPDQETSTLRYNLETKKFYCVIGQDGKRDAVVDACRQYVKEITGRECCFTEYH